MRIVIADDSVHARGYATRILNQAGHTVVAAASSGREAIALAAKHKPDIVVLDILMPDLTGVEAATAIQKAKTAKHIVVATSSTQRDILSGIPDGMHTIGKPYKDTQMVAELRALIPGF